MGLGFIESKIHSLRFRSLTLRLKRQVVAQMENEMETGLTVLHRVI